MSTFISFVTVKEITPCLCLCYVYVIFVHVNFCLNTKLLYKLLIEKATKDNHDIAESRTSFFMNNFNCSKAQNGYFCWKCFNMECSDYKIIKPMHLKCIDSLLTVKRPSSNSLKHLTKCLEKEKQWIRYPKSSDKVNKEMKFKDLYTKRIFRKEIHSIEV